MNSISLMEMSSAIEESLSDAPAAAWPSASPCSDQAHESHLIAGILAGNREAFAVLVRPYLGLFTTGIHRILQDGHDTQDALEEALLSIHAELHHFMGRSKFSTWAYRICLNEALMLRRSRMRRREADIEDFVPR